MIKYKILRIRPLEVSDRKVLKFYSSDPSALIFVNQRKFFGLTFKVEFERVIVL